MLRSLKISRFKSIRELNLEFGNVNLFIGGNGTGKSNVLEAIGLVSACISRGLSDSDIGNKGLRLTPPELMKSSFKNEDLPKTLEFEATFENSLTYRAVLSSRETDPLLRFFSESCHIGNSRIFGRSHRGAKATGATHADRLDKTRGMWDQIRASYEVPPVVEKTFGELGRFAIYTPQTDFLRGRQAGRVHAPPIGLHGEGLPEAVSSLLRQWDSLRRRNSKDPQTPDYIIVQDAMDLVWLPGWADRVRVGELSSVLTSRDLVDRASRMVFFYDKYMHASRNRLSAYDSSEGTLFLLFAAVLLAHSESPKVFALDNIDNALNPKLTRNLVEQVIRTCSMTGESDTKHGAHQVFLTSHNPTALDAFDLFDENQRVFVVRRNEKGHTVADRVKPSAGMSRADWDIATKGRNLSQLWLDNEILGAMGEL